MQKKLGLYLLALVAVFAILSPALAVDRTSLTPSNPPSLLKGTITALSANLNFVGDNAAGGYSFVSDGKEIILAWNTDSTNPYTVTVSSVAINGRTCDLPAAYSIAAGKVSVFGPYPNLGWRQTDKTVHIQASNDKIQLAIIRLP